MSELVTYEEETARRLVYSALRSKGYKLITKTDTSLVIKLKSRHSRACGILIAWGCIWIKFGSLSDGSKDLLLCAICMTQFKRGGNFFISFFFVFFIFHPNQIQKYINLNFLNILFFFYR